jgi:hypothetical protein
VSRPGHWPTPDGVRILRVALLEGEEVERGWATLRPRFDLDTLDEGSARLVPLLERNLRKHGLENPWADRMRGVYRYWWAHNQLLLGRLAAFLRALEDAGVPTIVLKGVAVGTRYYGDPGLRPMNDADVLVPRSRVPQVLALTERLGLTPEARVDAEFVRLRHGVSLRDAGGNTIDLHWAIHEDDCRPGADDRAWETAAPVEVAGVSTHMLAPAPLLLHACAHGSKWAADPGIRWIADSTLIIRAGDVDWTELVREAEDRRFVVRLRSCLGLLGSALGVVVPEETVQRLADAPVTAFERIEHRLRVRRYATLGELPRYWFAYLRTRDERGVDPRAFARYLQHAWGLSSARAVPAAAARRAAARLAGRGYTPPVARGPRNQGTERTYGRAVGDGVPARRGQP